VNLKQLANEMVDDEIKCFEEDGMTVDLSAHQIQTMKDETLLALCEAFNAERDALNDYIRAHAQVNEEV
jgi:hypothetical protein